MKIKTKSMTAFQKMAIPKVSQQKIKGGTSGEPTSNFAYDPYDID